MYVCMCEANSEEMLDTYMFEYDLSCPHVTLRVLAPDHWDLSPTNRSFLLVVLVHLNPNRDAGLGSRQQVGPQHLVGVAEGQLAVGVLGHLDLAVGVLGHLDVAKPECLVRPAVRDLETRVNPTLPIRTSIALKLYVLTHARMLSMHGSMREAPRVVSQRSCRLWLCKCLSLIGQLLCTHSLYRHVDPHLHPCNIGATPRSSLQRRSFSRFWL